MPTSSLARKWVHPVLVSVIGLILVYGVLAGSGFLQKRFLSQPFGYGADAPAVYGWNGVEYVYNNYKSRTGAPLMVQGRPVLDRIGCVLFEPDCTLIWIIGRATGSIVSGVNIYFYLTYGFCFLFALFALRFFGASWPASATMAALYALLPYHQMRNINHIHEDSYFIVPGYAAILYLVYRGGRAPVAAADEAPLWRDRLISRSWTLPLALLFVFFPASLQKYHQFFFAVFAFFAGVLGTLDSRKARPVLIGLLFAAVACTGLIARDAFDHAAWGDPHHLVSGAHQLTSYGEDERYPLKLVQMLLPIPGHRIDALAEMRATYDAGHPLVSYETSTVSLGLIGALGLLGLIWIVVTFGARASPLLRFIARLTGLGILLGMMGGLGGMLSDLSWSFIGPHFPLSQARGWDRIVIFIAFFALLMSAWGMDRVIAFCGRRGTLPAHPGRALAWCCAFGVFTLGVYDQVKSVPHGIYRNDDKIYLADRAFFNSIDAMYGGNSYQVLQWPVMFPWGGSYNGIYYTDAYRPLLNSRHMDLSFGGAPDSKQGQWLTRLSKMPAERIFGEMCSAGFEGALVHSAAVGPGQRSFVELLNQKATPVDSGSGLLYYDLRAACATPPAVADQCLDRLKANMLETDTSEQWIGGEQFAGTTGVTRPGTCGGLERESVAGQAGWLSLGPYVPMKPGTYLALFEFAAPAKPSELVVDWHDGKDPHAVAAMRPASAAGSFAVPFTVPAPGKRLMEFRVRVDGRESVAFKGVQVKPG
jgi:phosphoglycerol transferase